MAAGTDSSSCICITLHDGFSYVTYHPAPRLSSLRCDGVLEKGTGGAKWPVSRAATPRDSRACACRTYAYR